MATTTNQSPEEAELMYQEWLLRAEGRDSLGISAKIIRNNVFPLFILLMISSIVLIVLRVFGKLNLYSPILFVSSSLFF